MMDARITRAAREAESLVKNIPGKRYLIFLFLIAVAIGIAATSLNEHEPQNTTLAHVGLLLSGMVISASTLGLMFYRFKKKIRNLLLGP